MSKLMVGSSTQAHERAVPEAKRLYESVSAAADRVYAEVSEDVERFFRNRDPVYNAVRENGLERQIDPVLAEGRVAVHMNDGTPKPYYVAEEYVGTPDRGNTVSRRYALNGGAVADTLRDVYAPLAVAAERFAYAAENSDGDSGYDLSDVQERLDGDITAADARAVFNMAASLDGARDAPVVERTAYTADLS